MSRFEEVVNDAIGEVILGEAAFKAETLAAAHRRARARAPGRARAEVTIAARYPEHKPAPVSGIQTQEIYTLFGSAVASRARHAPARRRRRAGHDRLPVRAAARRRQRRASASPRDGFSDDEIERIFEHVPVATHNQRGLGTLHIGCPEDCDDEHRRRAAAGDRRGLDVARRSTS